MNNTNTNQLTSLTTITSGLADLENVVTNPPKWLSDALATPREQGFVDVDGCKINYFRWGDTSKPGIIMLHGFLAHARCFAFIAPYLAAEYHVIAYDFSGMGDSDNLDSYPIQLRVDELLSVSQQTGLFDHEVKPTIISHSYGGLTAISAVHAHPDKFAGLIVCDLMILRPSTLKVNTAKFKPPGSRDPNKANNIYPDLETAKSRFVLSPPQAVEQEALLDFMAYHSLKQVDGGWAWKFDPSVFNFETDHQDIWSKTGEKLVTAPGRKAVIYGKESLLFNADSSTFIDELIEEHDETNIPIIGIPHARHHLMLDQPIAFVSALKAVLAMWK